MHGMTEAAVCDILRQKWGGKEYAFLPQVRNQTGYAKRVRTADAIAMSLWPSRGLHLHGFEIKVSRSDWLHELKQPEKAEEIARFCHYWWLAARDVDIVKPGEVPPTWGFVVVSTGKPKVIQSPMLNKGAQVPTIEFVASLFRAMQECSPFIERDKAVDDAKNAGWQEGKAWQEEQSAKEVKHANEKREAVEKCISEFESASGLTINDPWWKDGRARKIGRAVQHVMRLGDDGTTELDWFADKLGQLLKDVNEYRSAVKSAVEAPCAS